MYDSSTSMFGENTPNEWVLMRADETRQHGGQQLKRLWLAV